MAALSLLLLWLPREFEQGEIFGVDRSLLRAFPGFVGLIQAIALASLGSAMTRAARLAHVLGSDIDLLLITSDKVLIDVTSTEVPDESSLFRSNGTLAGPLAWSYWSVRVGERLLSYVVFVGLLAFSIAIAIREILAALPGWQQTALSVAFFVGSVSLTTVAILRICQFWLIRMEGLAAWWDREPTTREGLPFFRRYSLTAILIAIGFVVLAVLWVLVVGGLIRLPLRLILRPWRGVALEVLERDRQYYEQRRVWYARHNTPFEVPPPDRPRYSVRQRVLRFAFGRFL